MASVILLVTGSRSLAENRTAEDWAAVLIHRAVAELHPGSLVVTGDARGPDRWAVESAKIAWRMGRGVGYLRFGRGGDVDGHMIFPWLDGHIGRPRTRAEWRERLLARDRAMVAWVVAQPGEKRCLALLDPASRTHGTEYTAREAERAGIAVRREVFCEVA